MTLNTIETIFNLMSKYNQEPIRQSKTLEAFYHSFDEKTKSAVDIIVKCICGYSLDTIINHPKSILNEDKS